MPSITKYRPFFSWPSIDRELERFFGNTFPKTFGGEEGEIESNVWAPRMDFSETEKEYMVNMDLPGIPKDAVNVKVEDNQLTITGERNEEKKDEKRDFHRIERTYGRFFRSVSLPQNALADKAKASFKDGVLTVNVPKTEDKKPHRIEVK